MSTGLVIASGVILLVVLAAAVGAAMDIETQRSARRAVATERRQLAALLKQRQEDRHRIRRERARKERLSDSLCEDCPYRRHDRSPERT